MSTDTTHPRTEELGRLLWDATVAHRPVDPVRLVVGAEDIDLAYRIQEAVNRHRAQAGARAVGRKIGLTSPAVQQQLKVDQPDFGVLFDDMARRQHDEIDMGALIAPKIEAEVAFVLAADLDRDDLTVEAVRAAIDYAAPALEIVDSRVRDWDISIVDTVADNASAALYVLGETRTDLDGLDLSAIEMHMVRGDDLVSSGSGRACLGDPLNAVLWLARTCHRLGSPLRAGEVVLSGALGPMVPAEPSAAYTATISDIGTVTALFGGSNRAT